MSALVAHIHFRIPSFPPLHPRRVWREEVPTEGIYLECQNVFGDVVWFWQGGPLVPPSLGEDTVLGIEASQHGKKECVHWHAIPSSMPYCIWTISDCPIYQPSGLKLLSVNARVMPDQTALIQNLIVAENTNLACITKTWLDELEGEEGFEFLSPLPFWVFGLVSCKPGWLGRSIILLLSLPVALSSRLQGLNACIWCWVIMTD